MRQKHLQKRLKPDTFGSGQAGKNLVYILNTYFPHLIAEVSRNIHKYNMCMNGLLHSWQNFQGGEAVTLMELYHKERFDQMKRFQFPAKVESHLFTVLTTAYRTKRRVMEEKIRERDKQQEKIDTARNKARDEAQRK